MKLRPLHDRIIVKRLEEERKTAGGIVIPDTAAEKPSIGEVLYAGPGKTDDSGKLMLTRYRAKDWDYLGWRYSLLSSIATAGWNHVIDMIPARDIDEFRNFPETDRQFFRHWLDWADKNKEYLRHTRTILDQPAIGQVDGTSAIRGDRGYVFLFNPNAGVMGTDLPLDDRIGVPSGRHWLLKELHPLEGRLIGKSSGGIWASGAYFRVNFIWPPGKPGQIIDVSDDKGHFIASALLDPQDRIVARVLSRQRMQLDRAWLTRRIQAAVDLRRFHAELGDTDAYRLVNGEGDGLPGVTIDRYGTYLMVQAYCAGWQAHLKLLTQVLQELLAPTGIYEKSRPQKTRELEAVSDTKRYGRLLAGSAAPQLLEVQENGLTFLVSLEQGLNTGLFLDQRRNRRDLAAGRNGTDITQTNSWV